MGEEQGGVGYAEVEFDAPTIAEVAGRYMVCSFLFAIVWTMERDVASGSDLC